MPSRLIERHARASIIEALSDTRVVFVMGARQVGKSTLTTLVAEQDHSARIITLDDRATRAATLTDPTGFFAGLDGAEPRDFLDLAQPLRTTETLR